MVDQTAEHAEETLLLEFAEGTKLFVPIAKIDLVQKYVGGGKAEPAVSKIGSSAWEKRKTRVAEAVVDLAAELIDIQAAPASRGSPTPPRTATGWPSSRPPSPTRRPPTSLPPSRPSSATWPDPGRWTA